MKIAVLLPGMVRTYKQCLPKFNEVFRNGNYEIKVFSSMWDEVGHLLGNKDYFGDAESRYHTNKSFDVNDVISSYGIAKHEIHSWQDWRREMLPTIKEYLAKHEYAGGRMITNGVLGQYYKVKRTFEMIEDPYQYHAIVRWRFDIEGVPIPFEKFPMIGDRLYVGGVTADPRVPEDFYFFGCPEIMKKVCSLSDYALGVEPFNPSQYHKIQRTYTPEILMAKLLKDRGLEFYDTKLRSKRIR